MLENNEINEAIFPPTVLLKADCAADQKTATVLAGVWLCAGCHPIPQSRSVVTSHCSD